MKKLLFVAALSAYFVLTMTASGTRLIRVLSPEEVERMDKLYEIQAKTYVDPRYSVGDVKAYMKNQHPNFTLLFEKVEELEKGVGFNLYYVSLGKAKNTFWFYDATNRDVASPLRLIECDCDKFVFKTVRKDSLKEPYLDFAKVVQSRLKRQIWLAPTPESPEEKALTWACSYKTRAKRVFTDLF